MDKTLCFSFKCFWYNDNANSDNTIFTIKDTKLYVTVVTLSAKNNQKLSKRLYKGIKNQCIGINIKQKVRIKILQMSIDIFLNQNLWELNDCLH